MKALQHFIKGDTHGIHYAVSISIATAVLWFLVHELAKSDPIWAIICPRIIKETLSIRTATLGLCFHACCAYIQAPLSDWFVSAKKPRKMVPTGWRSVCERWC